MIKNLNYNDLRLKAHNFKYSTLEHLEDDNYKEVELLCNNEKLILIKKTGIENKIYWATNNPQDALELIKNIKGRLYAEFVPADFVNHFKNVGFYIYAEYVDFFNNELAKTAIGFKNYDKIQFLQSNQQILINSMTTMCMNQSRGFEAESEEWFYKWIKNNNIIVLRDYNTLIGYCCVSVYANGTIIWIRRIAVDQAYQGKGYGKELLEQAILYGIKNGASRGFLHADNLNSNAIALYKKYGFIPKSESGEIIMKRNETKEIKV